MDEDIKPKTFTSPPKPVRLQIIPPSVSVPVATLPKTQKKTVQKKKVESESDNDSLDGSEEGSSTEEDDGFYVELSLTCTNDEGETEEQRLVFNFETEQNYLDQGENGFEELEGYFPDALSSNCPGWEYANEWEEYCVHGNELPDDYDGEVINVY